MSGTYQVEMKGKRYGRLVGLEYAGGGYWLFQCDCGNIHKANGAQVRIGNIVSCGCYAKEYLKSMSNNLAKHLKYKTPEYKAWQAMKCRCLHPSHPSYMNYGGRGITICERWQQSFENFLADMGQKPTPKHSLDRIDNDGGYCPENCRWATYKEQHNNTRKNVYLTHDGVTHSIVEWCDIYDIPRDIAYGRYRSGRTFEEIFNKQNPARKITDEEIKAIKRDGLTVKTFYQRFGKKISKSLIWQIKSERIYRNIK